MRRSGVDSLESWVVAAASSAVFLFSTWPMRLGGQLFVSMLDHFETNRKNAAFPFALAYLMRSVSGVGFGWATATLPEIINQHFIKHRAKAIGLMFGGSGLGAFATPPFLAYILATFGMSGTFLITSAILLHGVPVSMLLTKPRLNTSTLNSRGKKSSDLAGESTHPIKSINSIKSDKSEPDSKLAATTDLILNESNHCMNLENKSILSPRLSSSISHDDLSKVNRLSMQKLEHYNLEMIYQKEFRDQNRTSDFLNKRASIESKVKVYSVDQSSKKNSRSSVNVLWNPTFLLIATVTSAHFYVQYMYWTIIVDIGRDKGSEKHQEIYLVMALSLFDMLGRLSLGFITDSGFISSINFCAFCFACMGLLCLAMVFVSDFQATLVVTSILGATIGGNTTGLPGIVTAFFEKEKRSMAMASRLIMYAPMSFTMSPLIGYFRGTLGSYDGLLYVLMSLCTLCVFLLLMLSKSPNTKITVESNS
nr:uncharacterized protein LOC107436449 [Parasteatoda tepidariorum]